MSGPSDPDTSMRPDQPSSDAAETLPWYLQPKQVSVAETVSLVVVLLVHVLGYVAYRHWHGFGHAPETAATLLVQPLAFVGLLVHLLLHWFGPVPYPRWRVETSKALVAWQIVMIGAAWVLLWSHSVTSGTALTLMGAGATAGLGGSDCAAKLLLNASHLRQLSHR